MSLKAGEPLSLSDVLTTPVLSRSGKVKDMYTSVPIKSQAETENALRLGSIFCYKPFNYMSLH